MSFGLEQEAGSLITPMALAHPLHHIKSKPRNRRRNLRVGRCVSSWWPFSGPETLCWSIYLYVCILNTRSVIGCINTDTRSVIQPVLVKLHPITVYRSLLGKCAVPVLNATRCFLWFTAPGPSFRISDSTWHSRTPFCHIWLLNLDILQSSFKLCNWLSLRRLVSWIHHLPPVCFSSFWKSTFKQQLGGRFDKIDCKFSLFCIMTYAIVYVLIHHMIFRLWLFFLDSGLSFVSSTLVLTVSTDVVFILPIETYPP